MSSLSPREATPLRYIRDSLNLNLKISDCILTMFI